MINMGGSASIAISTTVLVDVCVLIETSLGPFNRECSF